MEWCSIDPGGTTGIAFWRDGGLCAWDSWRCGFGWKEQGRLVGEMADQVLDWVGPEGLLVVEDFVLRGGSMRSTRRDALSPVQVTGLMLGRMQGRGWVGKLELQSAANAKGVVTDARLKGMGLYRGNDHVRDAIRHGVLYLRKVGKRGVAADV